MTDETEAPKLLPCPFCGGDYQTWQNVRDGRSLGCSKCGAGFTKYNGPPDNSAETRLVNAWNTRKDLPDAKDKQITALEAERDHYAALYSKACDTYSEMRIKVDELEAKLATAMSGLTECEHEIDDYVSQVYPHDHPVQERSRQHGFSSNPARLTIEKLKSKP